MKIWLATVGEPLPTDGDNVRLLRTAQFAQWLARNGHDVTFWTGTMDHYGRKLRHQRTHTSQVQENYKIVQLAGRVYKKSVSYRRFMNHVDVAKSFRRVVSDFEPCDIVITSFPTEELCREILDYCEPRGIPVVVDVRDLWPDIFSDALPKPLRFLAPLAFSAFERKTQRVFRRATAISGPARSMFAWGATKAGRPVGPNDFWFPFTYPAREMPAAAESQRILDEVGPGQLYCFFGALSVRYNLEMVVDSFKRLHAMGSATSVMICGTGDAQEALRRRAGNCPNIHFPGWVNAEQISAIMERSSGGIFPYNTDDYAQNLPNKVCEYLAGGLPVISCTRGEVKGIIDEFGCGFWHDDNVDRLTELLSDLENSPDKLSLAAKQSRELYRKHFDPNTVFPSVVSKLESLLATAGGNATDQAGADREGQH